MSGVAIPPGVALLAVRHGATAWTRAGRLCGHRDVPLSRAGRAQARALRAWGRRVAAGTAAGLWTSDLRRAIATARLAGMGAPRPDPRLRELDFGELEGRRWEDLAPADRDALLSFDGFRARGGESVDDLARRVRAFLADLDPGEHVVVTHGGLIRLLAGGRDAPPVPPGGVVRLSAGRVEPWRPPVTPARGGAVPGRLRRGSATRG